MTKEKVLFLGIRIATPPTHDLDKAFFLRFKEKVNGDVMKRGINQGVCRFVGVCPFFVKFFTLKINYAR